MNTRDARRQAAAQHEAARARRAAREAAVLADVERRVAAAEAGKPIGWVQSSLIRDVIRTDACQRQEPAAVKLAERAAKMVERYADTPRGENAPKPAVMHLPFGGFVK